MTTDLPSIRRIELDITRRLDGLLHGTHLGLLPGPGSQHGDARPYQPGNDDVRHMDWAITARTTIPHIRELTADHELHTIALADLTPSMDFGTTTLTKRDLATHLITALGLLTARLGDHLGAHLHTGHGTPHRIPARTGRPALHHLLRTLTTTHPDTTRPPTTLTDALTDLAHTRGRPGLRVIVSDFLDPTPWHQPLHHLTTRHQVLAVEIIDPRELHLPPIGTVHLTDPETGHTSDLTLTPRLTTAYAQAAAAQRHATKTAIRHAGAAHLVLRTDRDWITDLARHTLARRRTRGRTPGAAR